MGTENVGVNRRQFLLRTGTLGAAAAVTLYPSVARAAGLLDPEIEDIAAPALRLLARDTVSGLVAFSVPGPDPYSQAQGVTDTRPGGIDARATDVFMVDLDDFLPVPDTYVHALAASFTTAVSDIPIPLELLGPLAQLGEQLAAQMDDALRALLQSDAAVPLSLLIAMMLNFLAVQVNPGALAGPFPTSPFANLSFGDKALALDALENADAQLVAALDDGAPQPLKSSLSGLLKFVGGALQEFGAYLSYGEGGVFDPQTKTVSQRPVGWDLSNYMPGRTTPADGWDELLGYFEGRQSTATDPIFARASAGAGAETPAPGGGAGVDGDTGGLAASTAPQPAHPKRAKKRRRHRRRKR